MGKKPHYGTRFERAGGQKKEEVTPYLGFETVFTHSRGKDA